jgi:hypothetical protein
MVCMSASHPIEPIPVGIENGEYGGMKTHSCGRGPVAREAAELRDDDEPAPDC